MWMMEQRLKCPDCGTRRDETDPEYGGDMHAYHALGFVCMGCKNVEQTFADARIKQGKRKGQLPEGYKVHLLPSYVWQERRRLRRQKKILAEREEAIQIAKTRREGRIRQRASN